MSPPGYGGSNKDASEEVSGELVVTGGDATEILETAEHAFDQVTVSIGVGVMGDERLSTPDRGDDSLDPLVREKVAQSVRVVSLIGDELQNRSGGLDEGGSHHDVMCVTGAQKQDPRMSVRIGQRVDLGRAPAARAADRFAVRPPFPPPADRWALMIELSIATVPVIPVDPVSASNISNQIPWRLHRLNRL